MVGYSVGCQVVGYSVGYVGGVLSVGCQVVGYSVGYGVVGYSVDSTTSLPSAKVKNVTKMSKQ